MSNIVISQAKKLAATFNISGDENELMQTLKATAFKGQVSDAQMAALMIVAGQYKLNPFTKEIYAFPDRQNGIVPVVGVDGWSRIINEHPQFDGMDFQQDGDSCTCVIYRKDRSHPIKVTEYMEECRRDMGPWKTHPRRMLRHKAMIQCARLAFGYVGIYEQDEAERILEAEGITTTQSIRTGKDPLAAAAANAPDGYDEYEAATLPGMQKAASDGEESLANAFNALAKGQLKTVFWAKHKDALKKAAADAKVIEGEPA